MDLDQLEKLLESPTHEVRVGAVSIMDFQAPSVVGDFLADKPRDPLYRLAESEPVWDRRTAIVATWSFIRHGQLDHDPSGLNSRRTRRGRPSYRRQDQTLWLAHYFSPW